MRLAVAAVFGLWTALGGLAGELPVPASQQGGAVLALDQTVTSCDEVSFDAALAALQADGGGTLAFDCGGPVEIEISAEKTITTAVTILGDGQVTLAGAGDNRLFRVTGSGELALVGLTLTNGSADQGGAIYNDGGGLTVRASSVSSNSAVSDGGAIYNAGGTLAVISATFTGNETAVAGGAIYNAGTATVDGSAFDDNDATQFAVSSGGAIHNEDGTLVITASTFNDNYSDYVGGAIVNIGDATVTIIASDFTFNLATHGGAIANSDGEVRVTASRFSDNRSSWNGGVIINQSGRVELIASSFINNTGGLQGGVFLTLAGHVIVTDSTFSENHGGDGAVGYNVSGRVTITGSTFSDNTAGGGGGALVNIYVSTDDGGDRTMTVTASTFTNNRGSTYGGAIFNLGSTLEVTASTFSGNHAASGGSIANFPAQGWTATLASSILTGPADSNCFGPISSLGYNLNDDDSCSLNGPGDVTNSTNINLGALADNGGPTLTMLPGSGSAALDNAACDASSAIDQRGATRPTPPATTCDIGAVGVGADVPLQVVAFVNPGDVIDEGTPTAFHVAAYGPDNDALVYRFDCDGDDVYESLGTCSFPDEGQYTVGLQVCDGAAPGTCLLAPNTLEVNVANVAPTINGITTNAPVAPGMPVLLTVDASDPGVSDILSYSFDCDDDGSYEIGPQPGNSASCLLAPMQASATINVLVEDGDGGKALESVVVSQAVTLCGSRYTGQLSAPAANGSCPAGSVALSVPGPGPTTLCINAYTGALTWSQRGTCGAGFRVHVTPDDGPLSYCQSLFTSQLRYSANGSCSAYERPGVIPG